jgi:hypothetical protein
VHAADYMREDCMREDDMREDDMRKVDDDAADEPRRARQAAAAMAALLDERRARTYRSIAVDGVVALVVDTHVAAIVAAICLGSDRRNVGSSDGARFVHPGPREDTLAATASIGRRCPTFA